MWKRTGQFTAALAMLAGCASPPDRVRPVAAEKPPPPHAFDVGEVWYRCELCHSTREMQRGPILDGLPAWYVSLQLRKFRDGLRGKNSENRSAQLMASGEAILKDESQIEALARHVESLPVRKHLVTVRGDRVKGREIYRQCAGCHGARGEGNVEAKGPPLTPLEDWYQYDQLRKFKIGQRGENASDVEGLLMAAAMTQLSNQDVHDVTRYIAEDLASAAAPSGATSPPISKPDVRR